MERRRLSRSGAGSEELGERSNNRSKAPPVIRLRSFYILDGENETGSPELRRSGSSLFLV